MVEKEAKLPLTRQVLRQGLAEFYRPENFDIEVHHNQETEERIRDLMRQNYGIVQFTNHWGLIEVPSVVKYNFQNPDLRRARILIPYAAHQYSEELARKSRWAGTELIKTATEDADEYFESFPDEKPDNYSDLNGIYVKKAVGLLSHGGVVLFCPQGKRESTLPRKIKRPRLATFLLSAQEEGLDLKRVAFMAIGTGLHGETDYNKWKDVEWNQPHPPVQIKIGGIYTFSESALEGRILTRADFWARSELAKVVPFEYLSQTT